MPVRPKVLCPPPQCHLSLDNPESQCPNLSYAAHVQKAEAPSIIRDHPFVLRLSKDAPNEGPENFSPMPDSSVIRPLEHPNPAPAKI